MSDKLVPLYCCFDGEFIVRERKICYTGGDTHIITVNSTAGYKDLLSKLTRACGNPSSSSLKMKYRYPGLDLDSNLVTISHDEDVCNMIMAFEDSRSRLPLELYINTKTLDISAAQSTPMNLERTLPEGANDGSAQGPSNPFEQTPTELNNQELPKFPHAELPASSSTLKVGLEFSGIDALKHAICVEKIRQCRKLKLVRKDRERCIFKCADEKCSWRISARKIRDSSTFQIESLRQEHTCVELPEMNQKQVPIKSICIFIKSEHKEKENVSCLIEWFKTRYGIVLSDNKVYRAKKYLASKEIQQKQSEPVGRGNRTRKRKHLASSRQILEKVPSEERANENQHRLRLEMDRDPFEEPNALRQTAAMDMDVEYLPSGQLGNQLECRDTIDRRNRTGQDEHLMDRNPCEELDALREADAVDMDFVELETSCGQLENQSECMGTIDESNRAGQDKHLASGKNFGEESSRSKEQCFERVLSQDVATEFGGQNQDLGCGENQQNMLLEIDQNSCEESSDKSLTGSGSMEIDSDHPEKVDEYRKKILETNPVSVAKFSKKGDEFRLYVTYDASLHSYHQSRCIISIESEKRKNFPHAVYLALGVDGNGKKFPLSIGAAEAETKESWLWFCSELRSVLTRTCSEKLTVSIDSEKILLSEAINSVFPDAYLSYDLKYLICQVCDPKTDHKLRSAIFYASIAETRVDFDNYMREMRRLSRKAYDWLRKKNPKHWSLSHFEGDWFHYICDIYDIFPSTIGFESPDFFLYTIRCVLDMPLITMMEEIREKAANLFRKRYQWSSDFGKTVVPLAEHILNANDIWFKRSTYKLYVVDLEKQTCSCHCWQRDKIPCCHAVRALGCQNLDPMSYCHEIFKVSRYKETYSKSFQPVDKSVKVRHGECDCFSNYVESFA